MDSALGEFDRCSRERRATPMNTELAARLIEKDDTKRLDRLMRLNTKVHGEMNSLYDLSLAFLRCNKVNQAKKVLEVHFLVCSLNFPVIFHGLLFTFLKNFFN